MLKTLHMQDCVQTSKIYIANISLLYFQFENKTITLS